MFDPCTSRIDPALRPMTASLFTDVPLPAGPTRRLTDSAFTARRVSTGGGVGIVHPCGLCGGEPAPFGFGVSLRAATATSDARRAGRWLCGPCKAEVGA